MNEEHELKQLAHLWDRQRGGNHHVILFVIDSNGCWVCTSHSAAAGYPVCKFEGRQQSISRALWKTLYGKIGRQEYVLHKCDNKKCLNPDHLEIGTALKNKNDERSRLGLNLGEKQPSSKLKEWQALEVIYGQETCRKLADRFGVNIGTIEKIRSGKTWGWLKTRSPFTFCG